MKLIFIIYIFSPWAWGDWSALFKAHTVDDLLIAERQIDSVDAIKRRCHFQLKHEHFPDACLLEISNDLEDPVARIEGSLGTIWDRVLSLCLNSVENLQSISQIKVLLGKQVPRTCHRALLLRLEDLEYLGGKKGTFLEMNSNDENPNRSESQL